MITEEEDKKFISLHADPDAWKGAVKLKDDICDSCLNQYWEERRCCDVCSPAEQWDALCSGKCEYYLKRQCPV